MSTWTPGRRRQQLTLETPFEGVPSHLGPPLWDWVQSVIGGTGFDPELVRGIGLELRIPLPNGANFQTRVAVINRINHYATEDDGFFLDLIEYLLEVRLQASVWDRSEPWAPEGAADVLERILEMGNSAYRVRHDRGGLEMRTMPEVQQHVQEAVNSSGAAGVHLAGAWNAAYSRTPDPVKSYSESIKAVEAALASKISPKNAVQTLGTMIRDVSSKPSKWTFAIDRKSVV